MSGFVYIWHDRKHKRFYVGSHWGSPNDGYVCSSVWMKQAYKHRPKDFKRRIISTVTTSHADLLQEEQRWLSMIKDHELKGVRYYNLKKFAGNHWNAVDQDNRPLRQKISENTKAAMQRPEVKENMLASLKTKNIDKEKIRGQVTDLWQDPAYREMMLEKKNSPEYKKMFRKVHSIGTYGCPWGEFSTLPEVAECSPLNITRTSVQRYYRYLDKPFHLARKIPKDWVGKTPRELGFWFKRNDD